MSKLSEDRIKKLENVKDVLTNLLNDIDHIIDGNKTQTEVARKYYMTPQEFNRNIGMYFGPKLKSLNLLNYEDFIEIYYKLECPSDKLIRTVLGLGKNRFAELPEYDEEKLYSLLDTLKPREKEVILLRFGTNDSPSHLSYEQCGLIFNVGKERVRQIEAKALRKLRHPSRIPTCMIGYSEIKQLEKELNEMNFKNLEARDELLRKIAKAKSLNENIKEKDEALENLINYTKNLLEKDGISINFSKADLSINIEELDFSVRTYNCLKRKGIKTLNDLLDLSYKDLQKVRNLGAKRQEEVIEKLNEFGFKLKDE